MLVRIFCNENNYCLDEVDKKFRYCKEFFFFNLIYFLLIYNTFVQCISIHKHYYNNIF